MIPNTPVIVTQCAIPAIENAYSAITGNYLLSNPLSKLIEFQGRKGTPFEETSS
jgi:hypothetical protein